MCEAMAATGCDVTLVARRGRDIRGVNPFAFYGTSGNVRLELRACHTHVAARGLSSLIGVLRVWKGGATAAIGRDLAGCYAAALLGLPVSYETHEPAARVSGVKRLVFTRLVHHRNFRRLIVITRTLQDDYQRAFNIPPHLIVIAPDAATEPAETVVPLRTGAAFNVGYVGQLYAGKGMEIIAPLAQRCPWADFHVVGGREEDIARWRAQCGAQTNLTFHGFVPHGQTDGYRNAFDVVLAPFQRRITIAGEGDIANWTSPLKVFEYMAAGKAILCSDLPVLREVMRDGDNCLLLPPDDVDAWTAALERLRDDPDLRARLGNNARLDFLEHYTWKARASRVLATLS
jgi:glycosyltransferase involved in cell wall biosynthesis